MAPQSLKSGRPNILVQLCYPAAQGRPAAARAAAPRPLEIFWRYRAVRDAAHATTGVDVPPSAAAKGAGSGKTFEERRGGNV